MPEPVCPECTQGKHANCDGTAWDDVNDVPVRCACEISNHTLKFEGIGNLDGLKPDARG